MIYNNIEFLNFDGFTDDDRFDGAIRLQRVPESLRVQLNPGAQERLLNASNGEIRFVADSPVKITLSSVGMTHCFPTLGDFLVNNRINIGKEPMEIDLTTPKRFADNVDALPDDMMFSTRVRRLLTYGAQLRFHGAEGEGIRPPAKNELPKRTLLTYGTSITNGSSASAPHLTYASLLARRLRMDLINLGVGGSCQCEKEFADYIAARSDWDVAVLALSVNMIGARFSLDDFYDRVSYMIDRVAGSNPKRPVFCVTIYPHFRDIGIPDTKGTAPPGTPEEYRESLRKAVSSNSHPNVHLIEGPEVLRSMSGLTPDLIHPSDLGMIEMAENLAKHMEPAL